MTRVRILAIITLFIGVFSALAIVLNWMALTDIWHGEQDVRLEWQIVSYAQLPMFVFHILALGLSISIFGYIKNREQQIVSSE